MKALARSAVANPLAIVLAGALALRIVALVVTLHPIGMDGANFARTAENLHNGYGYIGIRGSVNSVHVSLFPVLVAATLWLGASAANAAFALSIIAGALLTVPVYLIARRLFGARAAVVAAAIVALHPLLVEISTDPLADALALTLGLAGLAALLRAADPRWAAGAGAFFGLAYCTRSEGIGYFAIAVVTLAVAAFARRARPRDAAVRLGALTLSFLVFALPYIAAVSKATGHLRVDAKGAVNYAIASRIARGMSYAEAADGLGPGGREEGAELGDGFYATHPGIGDPSLGQRAALMAHVAVPQLARLVRIFASRPFGTPLFPLLAAIGCVVALRRPQIRGWTLVLLAFVAFEVAALLTLDHLWQRYAAVFVPFFAILAALPLVDVYDRLCTARMRVVRRIATASLTAIAAFGALVLQQPQDADADSALVPIVGVWLANEAPGPKLIADVGNQVAYYAQGDWIALPYASSADAIAYLRRKRPTYVVIEAAAISSRPYLREWFEHGIPAPEAVRVRAFDAGTPSALTVYAWRKP